MRTPPSKNHKVEKYNNLTKKTNKPMQQRYSVDITLAEEKNQQIENKVVKPIH